MLLLGLLSAVLIAVGHLLLSCNLGHHSILLAFILLFSCTRLAAIVFVAVPFFDSLHHL